MAAEKPDNHVGCQLSREQLASRLDRLEGLFTRMSEMYEKRISAPARPALHHVEPTKRKTIMQKKQPRRLCFNFKRIRKKEVYQAFLEIYAHGGIELNNQELISFLARHTNLGSEASITTLFYRYKQHVHV